jgi:hypothetical protein
MASETSPVDLVWLQKFETLSGNTLENRSDTLLIINRYVKNNSFILIENDHSIAWHFTISL